jgi:hypothetical protein
MASGLPEDGPEGPHNTGMKTAVVLELNVDVDEYLQRLRANDDQ